MFRLASTGIVFLLAATCSQADNSVQIQQLQQKIKQLKAERKALIKNTQAHYSAINKQVRWTEAELAGKRAALLAEEQQFLAVTTDPAARGTIRQQYDYVRSLLRNEIRLDDAARKKLAVQGKSKVQAIKANYDAQITQAQNQVQVLKTAKSATPKSAKAPKSGKTPKSSKKAKTPRPK